MGSYGENRGPAVGSGEKWGKLGKTNFYSGNFGEFWGKARARCEVKGKFWEKWGKIFTYGRAYFCTISGEAGI